MAAQSSDDGTWSWLMPQCNNVNGDWVFLVLVDNNDLEESILKEYLKQNRTLQTERTINAWITWFKATKRTTTKDKSKLKSWKKEYSNF